MSQPPPTTALIERVICQIPDCTKNYKSRSNMLNHIRTHHKPSIEVQSPLGNFPSSNIPRVLFHEDDQASIQGNSRGEVNSPKVHSIVSYQCGACDIPFESNEDAMKHIEDIHTKKTGEASSPSALTTTPSRSPTSATTTTPASSPTPNPTPASDPRPPFEDELEKDMDVMEAAAKEEQELYDALEQIT